MHFSPPAYLDPGSGSYLLQILIAAILALGVALRASWSRIKSLFRPRADQPPKADDDTP